jgi:hypothetical protein
VLPFNVIMTFDREISHDRMVAFNANAHGVPDGMRGRTSKVQIVAEGKLIAWP